MNVALLFGLLEQWSLVIFFVPKRLHSQSGVFVTPSAYMLSQVTAFDSAEERRKAYV